MEDGSWKLEVGSRKMTKIFPSFRGVDSEGSSGNGVLNNILNLKFIIRKKEFEAEFFKLPASDFQLLT